MGLSIGGTQGTGTEGFNNPPIPTTDPSPSATAQPQAERISSACLAYGAIPLVYGRCLVAPDVIFGWSQDHGMDRYQLVAAVAIGEGEIEAIESWCSEGGAAISSGDLASVFAFRSEKLGTLTQAAVTGGVYGTGFGASCGRMPGLAYAYYELQWGVAFFPKAVVKGRKLFDPRLGADPADPLYRAYSANPALVMADLLMLHLGTSTPPIDWGSVGNAADYCDTVMPTGEKRFECHLVVRERNSLGAWMDLVGAHFGAGWTIRDGLYSLYVARDQTGESPLPIGNGDLVASPRLSRQGGAGIADQPNRVTVEWTDPASGWAIRTLSVEAPEVAAGVAVREGSPYKTHGCQSERQALRTAWYLLNSATADLVLEGELVAARRDVGVGSYISVTDDGTKLADTEFLVTWAKLTETGTIQVKGQEYSSAMFSPAPYTPSGLPTGSAFAKPADVIGAALYDDDLWAEVLPGGGSTTIRTHRYLGATYQLPVGSTAIRLRVRATVTFHAWDDPEMAASEVVIPVYGTLPKVGSDYAFSLRTFEVETDDVIINALNGETGTSILGGTYYLRIRCEDKHGVLSDGVLLSRASPISSSSSSIPTPPDLAVGDLTLARAIPADGTELVVANGADAPMYLNLDSGLTAQQEAYLFFRDRGSSRFVIGKTAGGRLVIGYHDRSVARTAIDVGDSGSAPLLGLLGASPVARQSITGSRSSGAALQSVIALLVAFGLGIDNTTA